MKMAARNYITLGKFSIAIARVRGPTYTAYNPLPRIAAQMQQQVPDAVGLFIRPPPDLFVRQPLETPFDLRQKVFDQMIARARNEFLARVIHRKFRSSIFGLV